MLMRPSANRVYTDSALQLAHAELAFFSAFVLDGRLSNVRTELIGGVHYTVFELHQAKLTDFNYLANCSSLYALFRLEQGRLVPVTAVPLALFDDDLITIQKYSGKTNEDFTKLLLNITLLGTDFAPVMFTKPLRILDPLCGRGTTLNQALMYGYDAVGVDLDAGAFNAYSTFLKTWCQRKRIKHQLQMGTIRENKRPIGRRMDLALRPTGASPEDARHITLMNLDTRLIPQFFPKPRFHAVVTDLPYGVQHASRGDQNRDSRNPAELLRAAMPGWCKPMLPGSAMGLSWNSNVLSRKDVCSIMEENNLQPTDGSAAFEHRVDQAIKRDVVVGRLGNGAEAPELSDLESITPQRL